MMIITLLDVYMMSYVGRYNLLPNGDPDKLTLHGACPVLYGTKWGEFWLTIVRINVCFLVANKWIREGAQLFRRPCPLTK